jgi:hypothetical protein
MAILLSFVEAISLTDTLSDQSLQISLLGVHEAADVSWIHNMEEGVLTDTIVEIEDFLIFGEAYIIFCFQVISGLGVHILLTLLFSRFLSCDLSCANTGLLAAISMIVTTVF